MLDINRAVGQENAQNSLVIGPLMDLKGDMTVRKKTKSGRYEFEPLLDSHEVAKLMGVHPETVKRRARDGEIPGIKLGKVWRFRASMLESCIEEMILQRNGRKP